MKRALAVIIVLGIAAVAVAQWRHSALIEWVAQEKANDTTKAWLVVARDYNHLIDSYTTVTAAQKAAAMVRFTDAVCSGTTIASMKSYLTAAEIASGRVVWAALIEEWKAAEATASALQESQFESEF